MFCWHKWTKWRTYRQLYIIKLLGMQERITYETHQERTCTKCGKLQDREV
jgi:hypothetical protein